MIATELLCIQVGLGRKFSGKDGVEHQDLQARCILTGVDGMLGAARFVDYKLAPDEVGRAANLVGKQLSVHVTDMRQPFSGAPIVFEGRLCGESLALVTGPLVTGSPAKGK